MAVVRRRASRLVRPPRRAVVLLAEGGRVHARAAGRARRRAGHAGGGLTDRDGLYGAARFVARLCERRACGRSSGASLTVRAPTPPPGRSTLTWSCSPRTPPGYANLCRLITDAHMLGSAATRALDAEQVCAHADGLVALARAPVAPGPARRDRGTGRRRRARARSVPRGVRPERLFVGRRAPGGARIARTRSARCSRLADAAGVARGGHEPGALPGAAGRVRGRRARVHAADRAGRRAPRHAARNAEGWLKPAPAMRALFAERPDLCRHDARDRRAMRVRPRAGPDPLPRLPDARRPQRRRGAGRAHAGVASTSAACTETNALRDRLHHELSMIRRMGYAAYFLTVADIVADMRAMGIRCRVPGLGGRARSCATSPASPTSTRCATTCRSNGS